MLDKGTFYLDIFYDICVQYSSIHPMYPCAYCSSANTLMLVDSSLLCAGFLRVCGRNLELCSMWDELYKTTLLRLLSETVTSQESRLPKI